VNAGDAEQKDTEQPDTGQQTEGTVPRPSDEAVKMAKETAELYNEDRPTVVLPGSHGTISGTAINDWLDDDGNTIDHSKDSEDGNVKAESKSDAEG
jgi:hypothetical protein